MCSHTTYKTKTLSILLLLITGWLLNHFKPIHKWRQGDVIKRHYDITLCLIFTINEYIITSKFNSHKISGFKFTGGRTSKPTIPLFPESHKNARPEKKVKYICTNVLPMFMNWKNIRRWRARYLSLLRNIAQDAVDPRKFILAISSYKCTCIRIPSSAVNLVLFFLNVYFCFSFFISGC